MGLRARPDGGGPRRRCDDDVVTTVARTEGERLPGPSFARRPALLRRILREPQPVLDELRDGWGPVVGLGMGPFRLAVVGDPTALREMFAMSNDTFRWGHRYNAIGFVVGDASMIVSDGADHKRRRSSVQAAFSRRRLNRWIPMIVERTDVAIDALLDRIADEPDRVDLYPVGRAIMLDLIVRTLFGERLASRATEIGDLFQGPQDYLESPALRQLPHPIPGTRRAKVRADRAALAAIIDDEIARCRANPSGDPFDVLEVLATDSELSDAEIRDQVITLLGAGYDTTSATLAWMLWCTAAEPALWQRLRAEADEVYGPLSQTSGKTSTSDEQTLARLELAGRVTRETTRLHPAGAIAPRQAERDVVIGGYRVPKGTLILWSAHLAGRDQDVWDDPLRFDPDRFVDLTPDQDELAKAAWVPFGRGARNCIGFALAQMELTLIIARMAQRLDVATAGAAKPRPVGMIVNRPTGGAPLMVGPRG